jgi:hypothetical protein
MFRPIALISGVGRTAGLGAGTEGRANWRSGVSWAYRLREGKCRSDATQRLARHRLGWIRLVWTARQPLTLRGGDYAHALQELNTAIDLGRFVQKRTEPFDRYCHHPPR